MPLLSPPRRAGSPCHEKLAGRPRERSAHRGADRPHRPHRQPTLRAPPCSTGCRIWCRPPRGRSTGWARGPRCSCRHARGVPDTTRDCWRAYLSGPHRADRSFAQTSNATRPGAAAVPPDGRRSAGRTPDEGLRGARRGRARVGRADAGRRCCLCHQLLPPRPPARLQRRRARQLRCAGAGAAGTGAQAHGTGAAAWHAGRRCQRARHGGAGFAACAPR